jgi:hypothetical protein
MVNASFYWLFWCLSPFKINGFAGILWTYFYIAAAVIKRIWPESRIKKSSALKWSLTHHSFVKAWLLDDTLYTTRLQTGLAAQVSRFHNITAHWARSIP